MKTARERFLQRFVRILEITRAAQPLHRPSPRPPFPARALPARPSKPRTAHATLQIHSRYTVAGNKCSLEPTILFSVATRNPDLPISSSICTGLAQVFDSIAGDLRPAAPDTVLSSPSTAFAASSSALVASGSLPHLPFAKSWTSLPGLAPRWPAPKKPRTRNIQHN